MPRVPSQQSVQAKVLDDINQQSMLYSKKATLLSNMLEQAERFLSEMPGKIAVQTETNHPWYELAFAKAGGDWRLLLLESANESDTKTIAVTQGTILQKAQAAQLLPELYGLLISKLTEGQEAVECGLRSLSNLPFLDFSDYEDLLPKPVEKEDNDEIPF